MRNKSVNVQEGQRKTIDLPCLTKSWDSVYRGNNGTKDIGKLSIFVRATEKEGRMLTIAVAMVNEKGIWTACKIADNTWSTLMKDDQDSVGSLRVAS